MLALNGSMPLTLSTISPTFIPVFNVTPSIAFETSAVRVPQSAGNFSIALERTFSVKLNDSIKKICDIALQDKNEDVKHALTKTEGYFARLWSSETWKEWSEYRTDLGKVLHAFRDYVLDGKEPTSSLKSSQIEQASVEAAELLKKLTTEQPQVGGKKVNCVANLAAGTLLSAATKSPVPLIASSLSCLPEASAETYEIMSEVVHLGPGEHFYKEFYCRKIDICKSGRVPWAEGNDQTTCSHSGPAMKVSVINRHLKTIPYSGYLHKSLHVNCGNVQHSIDIENTSNEPSDIYVYAQGENAEFCTIM